MPRSKHPQRERTHDWQRIQQYTLWPEQKVYEMLRPVVLFNESAAERAKETETAERTLQRKAEQFESYGMASLFPKEPATPSNDARNLPPDMRQLIVDLQAEHPAFRPHEIATVCYVRFGRRPSHHTVQRVLASGPRPSITARRFPPYGEIVDGYERRRTVIRLHAEGWSVSTISAYMQTTRTTIYDILKRWVSGGHAELEDKSHVPHEPARKVTFQDIQEVRRLARNPDLGAFRVMAALEQMGIKLSQRTCGRLLAINRNLYGLEKPKHSPHSKKEMPFKASFRHQYWSVDVRYIEKHQIPDLEGPVYLISILENYSRAVLASKVSPTQNQWDYLEVLFAAFSTAGIPKAIVSDGGGIFYSNHAMSVYQALGIEKKRIDKKQAWQNYIETMFNIVRRMADFHFHQARNWEEMDQIHRKWVQDYNAQRHWAHEQREDNCHSPAEVIGWHKGVMVPQETLNRVLFAIRYTRHLDQHGFIRFQDWRLYGERGLAHQLVTVWVYEGTLKLEYQAVTLSKYRVDLQNDRRHIKAVSNPRLAETVFRSPQLTLFDLGPDEWLLYWKAPSYALRRRTPSGSKVTQLALFEMPIQEKAVGTEGASPFIRLVISPLSEHEDM
ncbi:MAG: helix-turn-helix domain-containing protein [Ktedonobacteraceae bacterium]|nr:helix-turn-helix domain-containing protein [Ktedonobacteraceae bacterium]